MGLRHLVKPQATVTLSDGVQTFTVSGLSPNHLFGLYHRHRGQLSELFDVLTAGGEDRTPETIAQMGQQVFARAPLLLAEIIALAAGGDPFDESETDGITNWQAEIAMAAGFPFPVQMDALQKIGDMTFTSDMPPKKFLGALVAMIQGARDQTSAISSGD